MWDVDTEFGQEASSKLTLGSGILRARFVAWRMQILKYDTLCLNASGIKKTKVLF